MKLQQPRTHIERLLLVQLLAQHNTGSQIREQLFNKIDGQLSDQLRYSIRDWAWLNLTTFFWQERK